MNVTLEDLRSVWSLGFDSGRIYGNGGATYEEQSALFEKDVRRLKNYDKKLARKIEKATRPAAGAGEQEQE